MFRKFTKKRLLVLTSVTALALAGIAFAFFSSTGSGSGTGSVANPTTTGSITVTGTVSTAEYPGGSSAVTFTAANSLSQAVRVHNVSLVSVAPDAGHSACDTSNTVFTMTAVTEDHLVPASATAEALPNNGTLNMADSGSSQDNCKGATLTLTLSSN